MSFPIKKNIYLERVENEAIFVLETKGPAMLYNGGMVPILFSHWLKLLVWPPYIASNMPLSCLGLPLEGNPWSASFWDPVLDRISCRLDHWKKVLLSLDNKITLTQSFISLTHSFSINV